MANRIAHDFRGTRTGIWEFSVSGRIWTFTAPETCIFRIVADISPAPSGALWCTVHIRPALGRVHMTSHGEFDFPASLFRVEPEELETNKDKLQTKIKDAARKFLKRNAALLS